jgi:phage minor structural protein
MKYPIIYDKKETAFTALGLAVLGNASEVKVREVINGEFLLTFVLPRIDPKWQYIQEENFVKVYDASQKKDQLFRIRTTEEQRDSTGKLTSNIQCEHIYYDALDCAFFPTFEMIGATPEAILQAAFADTRFTVGTVEITTLTDIMMSKTYASNIVAKLIENVGGELVKDNWTVNLVSQRGSNTGVQFRVGKNIKGLKKKKNSQNLVTRFYPYGKDGLEITPINGGQAYIDSPLINNYDRPRINYKDYDDIEENAELLAAALDEWSTSEKDGIDKPRVTYSGNFTELKKHKDYGDYEAYGLGDTVRIIDQELDTDTNQRILEYANYPYEPKSSDVVFANYDSDIYRNNRAQNVLASAIGTSSYVQKVTDSSGKIIPQWFANIRAKLQTEIEGMLQKALLNINPILFYDDLTSPTKALLIGPAGFAIANSKKSSGDWNWRTIGTGDKFIADEVDAAWIYAGEISADQITSGDFTAINSMKLGNNNSTNKVFRFATSGGMDAIIKAWTSIGPGLAVGCLGASQADNATPIDLEFFHIMATYLKGASGGTYFQGSNWGGLENSGYATRRYVDDMISQLNYATESDIDSSISQHVTEYHT